MWVVVEVGMWEVEHTLPNSMSCSFLKKLAHTFIKFRVAYICAETLQHTTQHITRVEDGA